VTIGEGNAMNSFVHEKRRTFNDRERAQFLALKGGRCAHCRNKIKSGWEWEIDHIIPIADGGTDDDENLQVLCFMCHSLKTKDDVAEIAKGKRTYVKAHVPSRHKSKRGWHR
jgi:5-methylcytosine-specific restriction endonuclease McrA